MTVTTADWVSKAEDDFLAAQLVMRPADEPLADIACFHCQQCAEKYLKAFMHDRGIEFPRIHPLVELLEICLPRAPEFETLRLSLEILDLYAIRIRYPGLSATPEKAQTALAAAARVRAFIRAKLSLD